MGEMEGVARVLCLWYVKELGSYNSWTILGGNYTVNSRVTLADSPGEKVEIPSDVTSENCLNLQ